MSCILSLPGCGQERITQEIPGGDTNCLNLNYTTANTFLLGSLEVFIDGRRLTQSLDFDEDPGLQSFTIKLGPSSDYNRLNKPLGQREEIRVDYIRSSPSDCISIL